MVGTLDTVESSELDDANDSLLIPEEACGDVSGTLETVEFNVLDGTPAPLVILEDTNGDVIGTLEYVRDILEIDEFEVAGTSTSTVAVSPGGAV